MALPLTQIRQDFPILQERIDGHPLIYLDSTATAQKPDVVLQAMEHFYRHDNGNAHRGMHVLAERATVALEGARAAVQTFIHAKRPDDIIFTKNCTEAINLVAKCFSTEKIAGADLPSNKLRTSNRHLLTKGDTVILSVLEHHANIVPWLQLAEERGVELRWIDIDYDGRLKLDQLDRYLAEGTAKLVAVTAQ